MPPETPAPEKLHGLDHLRALAITYVFLFHYFILSHGRPGWLPDLASFGWTGVDLFFVLSGFLISSQLFAQIRRNKKISFPQFFLKRFFRIVPAFAVTVGLYFCFPFFREKESLPPLWKFATFTQNLGLDLQYSGTFSHAWSLCVEEHFYLFLPLLLVVFLRTGLFKRAGWLLPAFFLLGLAVRTYCYDRWYLPGSEAENSWMYWYKFIYYPTYNRLDGLLAGVSIAAVYQFRPKLWARVSRYGNLMLVGGLLVLAGGYFLCTDPQTRPASVWGFPVVSLAYGFVVMGAVSSRSFLYRWQSKVTTLVATLSYSIYLTHKGIIHMTHRLLGDIVTNDNLMLIVCMITCLAGAWILNLAVEKPFMRLRARLIDR